MRQVRLGMVMLGIVTLVQLFWVAAGQEKPEGRQSSGQFIYQAGSLRDPFIPLIMPTPMPTEIPEEEQYVPIIEEPEETEEEIEVAHAPQPTPSPTAVPYPDLDLQGIMYDAKSPMAMINRRAVQTGDVIEGARVVRIDQKVVYLTFEGYPFEVRIEESYPIVIK